MKRVLFSLLLALTAQAAVAQSFPTKPLRLVVPYPAGGATDLMARVIAQKLSESFKQQVVVDNKPGAGGNIGVSFVARATSSAMVLAGTSAPTTMTFGMMPTIESCVRSFRAS